MKIYVLISSILTISRLMGSVQINDDPTFTKDDRALFRRLYSDENNMSVNGPKINYPDFHGKTPLYCACEVGRAQVAHFFLKELNADMDITAYNGLTPLEAAHKNGHAQVVALLVFWKKKSVDTHPLSSSFSN